MEDIEILHDWVTARMIRGQYIFTKEDVLAIGLPISDNALANSLMRMGKRGVIMSPWQNYHGYAVIDFIDNGCGLASEYRDNPEVIFNAFETSIVDSKNNKIGTGMGLFIAKGVIDKFKDSTISLLSVQQGFGIRTILKLK